LKNYFIYDTEFILQLINVYKQQNHISKTYFNSIIQDKNDNIKKVNINEEMLYNACYTNSLEVVSLIFNFF